MSDSLTGGRRFRVLTIVDDFSRESLHLGVARRFTGSDVAQVLQRLALHRRPKALRVDNGPEFTSESLDQWAYWNQVRLDFTRPGKPTDNGVIESFNARLRQECLNAHWFESLDEAQDTIDAWRESYNQHPPHSSLGNLTPGEFAKTHPERTVPE